MNQRTEDITNQSIDLIEQAYQRGFKDGYGDSESQKESLIEQAYRRGWKVGKGDGYDEGFKAGKEQEYRRGYQEGYSKAETDYHAQTEKDRQSSYELGLDVAWDAARRIVGDAGDALDLLDVEKIFGTDNYDVIMLNFSPSEAIEKIREWEEKQKHDEMSPENAIDILKCVAYHDIRPNEEEIEKAFEIIMGCINE